MIKLLLYFIIIPLLFTSCGEEEDPFAKAEANKKVFAPQFKNVKNADTIDVAQIIEGTCSKDADIILKSDELKNKEQKVRCSTIKNFTTTLEWNKSAIGKKVKLAFYQSKGGGKSPESVFELNIVEKKDKVAKKPEEKKTEEKKDTPKNAPAVAQTTPTVAPSAAPLADPVAVAPPPPPASVAPVAPVVLAPPAPPVVPVLPPAPVIAVAPSIPMEVGDETKLDLSNILVVNEIGSGGGKNFNGARFLVDEQKILGDPKSQKGNSGFTTQWTESARLNPLLSYQKNMLGGIFDLGKYYDITNLYIFGGNNLLTFYGGGPINKWMELGQIRLRPGQWNEVSLKSTLTTRYIRIAVDFLNPDPVLESNASSGSEIAIYGKPRIEKNLNPSTQSSSNSLASTYQLKRPLWEDFLGVTLQIHDPLNNEFIEHQDMAPLYKQRFTSGVSGPDYFTQLKLNVKIPWFISQIDPNNPNWFLKFDQLTADEVPFSLDYLLRKLNMSTSTTSLRKKEISLNIDYSIPSLFPNIIKDELNASQFWTKNPGKYPWEFGRVKPLSDPKKVMAKQESDFLDEGELYYQWSARFGKNPLKLDQKRKLASDQAAVTGSNMIASIEGRSYPDSTSAGSCPQCSFFTPKEYALYMQSIYDGGERKLGPGIGTKQADPALPVVLGALTIPSFDYILMMKLWAEENRSDGKIPFDILNYTSFLKGKNKNQFPEQMPFFNLFQQLINQRNIHLPDRPLWVSDFGVDSSALSPYGVVVAPGHSEEITQSNWLMRSLLLLSAAGVDRVYLHSFSDQGENAKNSYFTSGIVKSQKNGFVPKASYFDLGLMTTILTGTRLKEITDPFEESKGNLDAITLRYESEDMRKNILVTWTPTNNGSHHQLAKEKMKIANSAEYKKIELVKPNGKDLTGNRSPSSLENGDLLIDISETPTFIILSK